MDQEPIRNIGQKRLNEGEKQERSNVKVCGEWARQMSGREGHGVREGHYQKSKGQRCYNRGIIIVPNYLKT